MARPLVTDVDRVAWKERTLKEEIVYGQINKKTPAKATEFIAFIAFDLGVTSVAEIEEAVRETCPDMAEEIIRLLPAEFVKLMDEKEWDAEAQLNEAAIMEADAMDLQQKVDHYKTSLAWLASP